jgi:hypothetical protein
MPRDFDLRAAAAAGHGRIEGREVLKVFATTQEADLSGWRHTDTSRQRTAASTPRAADDLWTVRTLSFLVRRAPPPDSGPP